MRGTPHFVFGGAGFLGMVGACFVLARLCTRGEALYSRITVVAFLAAFVGIASGSGNPAVILAFTATVIAVSVWLALLSLWLYAADIESERENGKWERPARRCTSIAFDRQGDGPPVILLLRRSRRPREPHATHGPARAESHGVHLRPTWS
ncbi:MAG: hypothetical protein ABW215_11460 [Kibdelosporangium sp.]